MKRDAYLKGADVQDFIEWATPLVTGKWGLHHSWQSKRPLRHFECTTLYGAYKSYCWKRKGFDDTADFMDRLRREFKEAVKAGDEGEFRRTAKKVLKWGDSNLTLPDDALSILTERAKRLDPECSDTDGLRGFKYMGAGYSKIYSLMLDDFPIYDSRVGCALTSLIWLFCKENASGKVPGLLKLVIPPEKGDHNRNPSDGTFKSISASQYTRHADSNLKAAWLLGVLVKVDGSEFDSVLPEHRVLALQSALFMLGYRTLDDNAVVKKK